ncbi:hypothetical protein CBL_03275 [Carabus blaptoides fortunei]
MEIVKNTGTGFIDTTGSAPCSGVPDNRDAFNKSLECTHTRRTGGNLTNVDNDGRTPDLHFITRCTSVVRHVQGPKISYSEGVERGMPSIQITNEIRARDSLETTSEDWSPIALIENALSLIRRVKQDCANRNKIKGVSSKVPAGHDLDGRGCSQHKRTSNPRSTKADNRRKVAKHTTIVRLFHYCTIYVLTKSETKKLCCLIVFCHGDYNRPLAYFDLGLGRRQYRIECS